MCCTPAPRTRERRLRRGAGECGGRRRGSHSDGGGAYSDGGSVGSPDPSPGRRPRAAADGRSGAAQRPAERRQAEQDSEAGDEWGGGGEERRGRGADGEGSPVSEKQLEGLLELPTTTLGLSKGKKGDGWATRYCVLEGGMLRYFRGQVPGQSTNPPKRILLFGV